jgi:ComF family protein
MPNNWQPWLDRALNLFLKPNCPLCDRSTTAIFCRYCQRQVEDCQLAKPDRYWQGDLPLFAWGKYEGAIKQSIAKLKYDGHRSIADFYGEALAASWQKNLPPNVSDRLIVMPIPLHVEKLVSRGFNQAELIARRFCQLTNTKLDLNLQRTRSTVAQFGLSKTERQANVADAFVLAQQALPPGATVLLIDDIYTTGATVRSVAMLLKSLQIEVCGVAVVAIAERDN